MQQSNFQQKQTSGRRRHPRNTQGAQKSYASENDAQSDNPFQPDFSTGSPQTPQKSNSGSPAPSSVPQNSKSNKRTGNKSRPKNVSTSPRPVKPGRHTPPHTAAAKQPTSTAFAGATFHASPAPSSLPIPSFLSKSGTDSPGFKNSGKVSQEPSPPTSDSDTPTLQPATISQTAREESPLDLLFRADRAEKERARRTSSANAMESVIGPFSPPTEPRSPPQNAAYSRGSNSQPRPRPTFQRNASSGISSTELDGTPGRPMGPAFSTPYQDRIKAARSADRREQQSPRVLREQQFQQHPTPPSSDDKSEALKKFLFGGPQAGQQQSAAPSGQQNRMANPPNGYFPGAPVSYSQQMPSPPATHNPETDRSAEFAAIEDSLRRVLKLDMNMSSGPTLANAHRS